jgi:hypothetical protein
LGAAKECRISGRITLFYERIPGALEQGNFGSHQGIELGKSGIVWQGAFIGVIWPFVLKENELWLVMKALVVNQTQSSGGDL